MLGENDDLHDEIIPRNKQRIHSCGMQHGRDENRRGRPPHEVAVMANTFSDRTRQRLQLCTPAMVRMPARTSTWRIRPQLRRHARRAAAGCTGICLGAPSYVPRFDDMLGRPAVGHRADLVAFDPKNMTVIATWVAGSGEGRQSAPSAGEAAHNYPGEPFLARRPSG